MVPHLQLICYVTDVTVKVTPTMMIILITLLMLLMMLMMMMMTVS